MNLRTTLSLDVGHSVPAPANESANFSIAPKTSLAVAASMQQLIDDLPEEIALLDERANILTVNKAWRQSAEAHGHLDALPGNNYSDVCASRAAAGYQPAIQAMAGLNEIMAGERDSWLLVYNGGEHWGGRDYEISAHRIRIADEWIINVTRHDRTEILQLRRKRVELAETLIEGQAVERQRIGRELHDSTSQLLAAMGLVLGRLRHESPQSEAAGLVEEMQELLQEVHQEIRSVSYLAHPPSLRKLGLADALRSLVDGFGRRTGCDMSFEIKGRVEPTSAAVDSAMYRLAQEALSNVHRHAQAARVRVHLTYRRGGTHIIVADDGIGISSETLSGSKGEGVGLRSMRSRLSEVGGRLTVRRLLPGTAIIGSVPVVGRVQPVPENPPSSRQPSLVDQA